MPFQRHLSLCLSFIHSFTHVTDCACTPGTGQGLFLELWGPRGVSRFLPPGPTVQRGRWAREEPHLQGVEVLEAKKEASGGGLSGFEASYSIVSLGKPFSSPGPRVNSAYHVGLTWVTPRQAFRTEPGAGCRASVSRPVHWRSDPFPGTLA